MVSVFLIKFKESGTNVAGAPELCEKI